MGCGSSSTADPKSGKPQNQTSTRQENRVRENKVTPQKPRDLKLNFEDFQQIDEHARKVKKPRDLRKKKKKSNRVNPTIPTVDGRDVPNSQTTQPIHIHPVKKPTVNDNDVPNSDTPQPIHPVKERTVNDSDVPNSHTTQPIHPVKEPTVIDNDVPNSQTPQPIRPVKERTVIDNDVPNSQTTQPIHPVKERTVIDNDVPNSQTTQPIHPVKEPTVIDNDVPNSQTTQPIHPVKERTVIDNDVPNSQTTQPIRPVKERTVIDNDVPNSQTTQPIHPVKERTVIDNDVPNSQTTQPIHPVKEPTVIDNDVPNSQTTQPIHPVKERTVIDNDVPNSQTTQPIRPVKERTVIDNDVPNSQTTQPNRVRENKVTPTKHRDLKLNFEDFQQIDEHARKAPSSVEKSVDTLANYLAKPAKNDLEKVRALYVWICENIRYNTDAFFSGNLSSVASIGEDVLKCKSSVCEGYARLFEALCLSLGITCKKISGYAKGYGHNAGDVISYDQKTNHAWNVVELDGTWQFIETTWGAGSTDENKKFNKEFTNVFFLTPPHNFITDHFPYMNNNIEDSKQWQLLENPLTLEVYSKSIKPSKEARHFGIEFPSHPYDMITVKNSCTIIVESKADILLRVLCHLYDDHGSTCDESIIVLKEKNCKYKVTVRPRRKGRYELHVYGTIDKSHSYPQLVAYLIDCVSVETDFMAYPTNCGYYGPQLDYIQRGFHTPDVVQPFHMCKNGEFELEVKTTTTPEITTTMFDVDATDQKDYTLVEQTDDTIYIRARFTKKGYYKLTIFSEFGKPQEFTEALILLIFNSKESETTSSFPLTYTATREYKCRLLEPLVRDIPANSEVQFQFTSPELTKLLVNKKVHTKENGDVWSIVAETGDSGNLKLSGNPSDGSSYSAVYGFVIKS